LYRSFMLREPSRSSAENNSKWRKKKIALHKRKIRWKTKPSLECFRCVFKLFAGFNKGKIQV